MSCPTNHTVEVSLLNVKVYVKTVEHIQILALSKHICNHLNICTTFFNISGCIAAYLNTGRVKRSILILVRADQYDMLKPLSTLNLTKSVKSGLLYGLIVGHRQLI